MAVLQDLAAEVGAPERTVRRAVEERTLRSRRPTPRTLVVDDAERAYARQNWGLLQTLRRTLRTEPNVRAAVLFGSTARGDAGAHSDVDILIDWKNKSRARPGALTAKLEGVTSRRVDLVDWEQARRSPLLMEQVLHEGRVLVDRDYVWPRTLAKRDAIIASANRHERRLGKELERSFARLTGHDDSDRR